MPMSLLVFGFIFVLERLSHVLKGKLQWRNCWKHIRTLPLIVPTPILNGVLFFLRELDSLPVVLNIFKTEKR